MSRFLHNDLAGETIAKHWHYIAQAISLAAAVSGIGIFITAGAGYFWHRWAVEQHQEEIERMLKESCHDSKDEVNSQLDYK